MRTHTQAMLVMLDVLSTKPYGLWTCSTPPREGQEAIAAHLALTALEDLGLAGWTPIVRNSRFYRLTPLGWPWPESSGSRVVGSTTRSSITKKNKKTLRLKQET